MKYIFAMLFLIPCFALQAQEPVVFSGKIVRLDKFSSKLVSPRTIDVWLPEQYQKGEKYPVLYMHDGQMLFDSTHTWTHTEWGVDETLTKLIREKQIGPCIVVAIWNTGLERHTEYFPQKPFELLSAKQQDSLYNASRPNGYSIFNDKKIHSDAYLKFIVEELKPYIDQNFSTRKESKYTFIGGSSMGGLISLYAICEYPDVFGGAACLSTHWPGVFEVKGNPIPDAFFAYMKAHLPDPSTHKIYFDLGDQTLDALYPPLQEQADGVMKEKGFTSNNWQTRFFPGENHSEISWAKRLYIPLLFLMGK